MLEDKERKEEEATVKRVTLPVSSSQVLEKQSYFECIPMSFSPLSFPFICCCCSSCCLPLPQFSYLLFLLLWLDLTWKEEKRSPGITNMHHGFLLLLTGNLFSLANSSFFVSLQSKEKVLKNKLRDQGFFLTHFSRQKVEIGKEIAVSHPFSLSSSLHHLFSSSIVSYPCSRYSFCHRKEIFLAFKICDLRSHDRDILTKRVTETRKWLIFLWLQEYCTQNSGKGIAMTFSSFNCQASFLLSVFVI